MPHTISRLATVSLLICLIASAILLFVPQQTRAQQADDYGTGGTTHDACPSLSRTLQRGARDGNTDGQVSELQQFLADRFDIDTADAVTGFFGRNTQNVVIRFQREQGLPAFGIVGQLTRAKIAALCATPSSSNHASTSTESQMTVTPTSAFINDSSRPVSTTPPSDHAAGSSNTTSSANAAIPSVTLTQDIETTTPGQFWTLSWSAQGTAMDRCEMTAKRPDGSVVAPFDPYSGYVGYEKLDASYPAPVYPVNARRGSIHVEHTQVGIFIFTIRCRNATGWSGMTTISHQVTSQPVTGTPQTVVPVTAAVIPSVTLTQDNETTTPGQFWTLSWSAQGTAMDRCEMTAKRPDGSVVAPFDPYSGMVDYAKLQSSYPTPQYPLNSRTGSIHAQHTQIGVFIFTIRCHNATGWSGETVISHQVRNNSASNLSQMASVLSAIELLLIELETQLNG